MAAPTITSPDSSGTIVRTIVLHAGVIFAIAVLPLLIVSLVVGSFLLVVLAVVAAAVVGAGVTAWRLRRLDERLAERFGARRVNPGEFPRLDTVVESVAMAVGIAPPRARVIESDGVNAIVWGFGDEPVDLAITTGLLAAFDRVELEAVVAHLAAASRVRQTDAITVAAALAAPFSGNAVGERAARLISGSSDPRAVVLADIEGAKATRYPPAMTSALEKMSSSSTIVDSIPAAFTSLCLAAPVADAGPFSVHPPVADRIDLMREW